MSVQFALTNNTFETEAGVVSIPVDDSQSSFGRAYSSAHTDELLDLKEDLTNKIGVIPATPAVPPSGSYPTAVAVQAYCDNVLVGAGFLKTNVTNANGTADLEIDTNADFIQNYTDPSGNGWSYKFGRDNHIAIAPITANVVGTYTIFGADTFVSQVNGPTQVVNGGVVAALKNGSLSIEVLPGSILITTNDWSYQFDNTGKITRAEIVGGLVGTYYAYLSHPDWLNSTVVTDTTLTMPADGYVILRSSSISAGVNISATIGSIQVVNWSNYSGTLADFVSSIIPVNHGDIINVSQAVTIEFYPGK